MSSEQPSTTTGIIILGMHRSGTSLFAELVDKWGAYGNSEAMIPADEWNSRGYWEWSPLVRFNDEILATINSRWNVPPTDQVKQLLGVMATQPDIRQRAEGMLAVMTRQNRPWYWKDPRLALLLPFWKRLWSHVIYLIVVRQPVEIALSLNRRDGFSLHTSLVLWQRYISEILADADVRTEGMFLAYDSFVSDPQRECQRLCNFLDERLTPGGPVADRLDRMITAIDPHFSRSRSFVSYSQSPPPLTETQRRLYTVLQDHCTGEQRPVPDLTVEPNWREALVTQDILHRLGLARSRCQIYWRLLESEYCEQNSRSVRVAMDGAPHCIQLQLPPIPGPGPLRLRLDLTDRPTALCLVGMKLRGISGTVVWAWDGRCDSIANMNHHEVLSCHSLDGETAGCTITFTGSDPWIELPLSEEQSTAVRNGALLVIDGTYSSSAEHVQAANAVEVSATMRSLRALKAGQATIERLIATHFDRLRRSNSDVEALFARFERLETDQREINGLVSARLEQLEAARNETNRLVNAWLEQLEAGQREINGLVSARLEQLETSQRDMGNLMDGRLQQLQATQAQTMSLIAEILTSRIWRTMVGLGGVLLRARIQARRLLGAS